MPTTNVVTLRLEPELRQRLDQLAKAQRRSRSFVAADAIREYVATNRWQIEEIQRGLEEAEREEFATARQVQRVLKKWTARARPRAVR